jgi:radical SAM/Cys-rich protein
MNKIFSDAVKEHDDTLLFFDKLEILQINLGSFCNQLCSHCHLGASPSSVENMKKEVMTEIISFFKKNSHITLDITGGSPELHPDLEWLITNTHTITKNILLRSNLTAMEESGDHHLPEFLKNHNVTVIASLPCYTKQNVDTMRGDGVFNKSISALKKLNKAGYGINQNLYLVYNPSGPVLPGNQSSLEKDYHIRLREDFNIEFTGLYTITNAPLGRFKQRLEQGNELETYYHLLYDNFNKEAAQNIMCKSLISVDWNGYLYNCDFNQPANLPLEKEDGTLYTIYSIDELLSKSFQIKTGQHCFACTAGSGSSCQGSLTS